MEKYPRSRVGSTYATPYTRLHLGAKKAAFFVYSLSYNEWYRPTLPVGEFSMTYNFDIEVLIFP